ncbi:MAG: RHS repeat-associated core domain-containing protein, partial [Clostridia bacterium]|nr:RHS repeat-associated core domain-containing protein [Clostridia bacterium]
NNSNTKLASYLYDAWGNHTVTYHNGGGILTAIVNNPIRYRGYYYDIDLGLYYLQTRYYDSNIGRFINADGYISTGSGLLGYNMYAYCNNNPVMYVDPSGESIVLIIILIIAVVSGLTSCSTAQESNPSAEKSITDNINMYYDDVGWKEGKINVKFSPNGNNPSFQIRNSYEIVDEDDQRAILEYIMNSEYYSQDIYGRTMNSMIIEWQAHNELYNQYPSERLKHVDFDKNSEGWSRFDFYKYAIYEYLGGRS